MATLTAIKAANYDITYYNADSYDLSVTITDQDGSAVDLSGDTLTMTIKKKKTNTTAVATLSTASEIAVSGASNNVVTISFNIDLDERSYYYDLYNNTDDDTIMYGMFIVTGEVHA